MKKGSWYLVRKLLFYTETQISHKKTIEEAHSSHINCFDFPLTSSQKTQMEDSHAQEPLHQGFGSFQAFHNIAWPGCTATAEIEISSRCNYKNRGQFEKKKKLHSTVRCKPQCVWEFELSVNSAVIFGPKCVSFSTTLCSFLKFRTLFQEQLF